MKDFTTVDLDFVRHYRPQISVVTRPTLQGGGVSPDRHHEIMFPLFVRGRVGGIGDLSRACCGKLSYSIIRNSTTMLRLQT